MSGPKLHFTQGAPTDVPALAVSAACGATTSQWGVFVIGDPARVTCARCIKRLGAQR